MIFKDFGWVWEGFWQDYFFLLKGLGGTNFWEPSFEDQGDEGQINREIERQRDRESDTDRDRDGDRDKRQKHRNAQRSRSRSDTEA